MVAATNVNIPEAIQKGKFREDLYYRLNTVPIQIPALRERGEDILLLFRKFASDFAERYKMPPVKLDQEAQQLMLSYRWPGNVRQLKNVTEQISIIENERMISAGILAAYLPGQQGSMLPALVKQESSQDISEREILYKVLFDMRKDMVELKKLMIELLQSPSGSILSDQSNQIINRLYSEIHQPGYYQPVPISQEKTPQPFVNQVQPNITEHVEVEEESLSLEEREKELIVKALEKYRSRRKNAARELGISERTLYRKIKEYNIDL
jgi:DNA-binding NtrC family response regulator